MVQLPHVPGTVEDGGWFRINRRQFFISVTVAFVLLQLLFFVNIGYLYGALHHGSYRVSHWSVLAVDYDGGVIGEAAKAAYQKVEGISFPGFDWRTTAEYPTPLDAINGVCRDGYWAAVYTAPGASKALDAALAGNATPAYNPSQALYYAWNGARYPSMAQRSVINYLTEFPEYVRQAWNKLNGTKAIQDIDVTNPIAFNALMNPIMGTQDNLQATTQGVFILLNTVTLLLATLQQWFFLMSINGISGAMHVFGRLTFFENFAFRQGTGYCFTLIASLCITGLYWAFREGWVVNANQFVLTWMALWLYDTINMHIIDVITCFVPVTFVGFVVLTYMIINLTSGLSPFVNSPGFYRWAYALPQFETYQVLIQIWSGGCMNRLYQALPILFSEWLIAFCAATFALFWRCHQAMLADAAGYPDEPFSAEEELEMAQGDGSFDEEKYRSRSMSMASRKMSRRESQISRFMTRVSTQASDPTYAMRKDLYFPAVGTPMVDAAIRKFSKAPPPDEFNPRGSWFGPMGGSYGGPSRFGSIMGARSMSRANSSGTSRAMSYAERMHEIRQSQIRRAENRESSQRDSGHSSSRDKRSSDHRNSNRISGLAPSDTGMDAMSEASWEEEYEAPGRNSVARTVGGRSLKGALRKTSAGSSSSGSGSGSSSSARRGMFAIGEDNAPEEVEMDEMTAGNLEKTLTGDTVGSQGDLTALPEQRPTSMVDDESKRRSRQS